jgi:hypothetical protein
MLVLVPLLLLSAADAPVERAPVAPVGPFEAMPPATKITPAAEPLKKWPRWPGVLAMGVASAGLTGALYLHALANLCFFGTGCPTDWNYERPAIGIALAAAVLLLAGAVEAWIATYHNVGYPLIPAE